MTAALDAAAADPVAEVEPLLTIEDLSVRFRGVDADVHAVNGVSLELRPGEVLAILGESGSGKSVTLRSVMRLLPRHAVVSGRVVLDGHDILSMSERRLTDLRGPVVSMIFQEPGLALDPIVRIGRQITEMIRRHERVSAAEARERARALFERVRIPLPERRLDAFPNELSGGMRQRAMTALALSARPKVLLADEPTTALDATVQIQILLLLRELQETLGMAVIFVTHDVGVAAEIADRVAVMYAGTVVEHGTAADVLKRGAHPYTVGLMRSTVHGAVRGERLDPIPGAPPALTSAPDRCMFAPRCAHAHAPCLDGVPAERDASASHRARCVLVGSGAPAIAPA
ncbi:ABC transporter ATP-binding protein [Acuticoccus sp.]|uniref:ABC transporter ATP-binding protein n=1 Tax=Acuticoccus sp. TaxID=1904378 RepID=UPI003B5294AC